MLKRHRLELEEEHEALVGRYRLCHESQDGLPPKRGWRGRMRIISRGKAYAKNIIRLTRVRVLQAARCLSDLRQVISLSASKDFQLILH